MVAVPGDHNCFKAMSMLEVENITTYQLRFIAI